MKPSIGRIVHYQLGASDVTEIQQRRGDVFRGSPVKVGDVYPAMIVRVNGDPESPSVTVNLKLFLDGIDVDWFTSRMHGNGAFMWKWPGQAAPIGVSYGNGI
jgi:hypothetical protein